MHTINSACQMHQERNTGSIETGKYADLIVLSQDLFAIPTERISGTRVLLTILGGAPSRRSFSSTSSAPSTGAAW